MAPGRVTASAEPSPIRVAPSRRTLSAENPAGARPEALSPITSPPGPVETSANMSPPIPVICGSQMPARTAAAIAASTALPPASSISTATLLVSGWDVAAMPFVLITTDRPGR